MSIFIEHTPEFINNIGEDIKIATMSEFYDLPCARCGQPFGGHFGLALFRQLDKAILGPLVSELPPEGFDDF